MTITSSQRLYFDCNATAPLAPGLVDEIALWLAQFGNPSSVHQEGQKAKSALEVARKFLLTHLGCSKRDQLIFTSGGTESNNQVLQTAFLNRGEKNTLVLSTVEHSCVLNTAQFLEKNGAILKWIDVDANGSIDLAAVERLIDEDVFLVSVMLANNETGNILPVQELAKIAREREVLFHTDAVCAVGKLPINFTELGVDYLTFSAHKFGALKGVGGIIQKASAPLGKWFQGGPQEFDKRAGTQNLVGILSAEYALKQSVRFIERPQNDLPLLRKKLANGIKEFDKSAVVHESENQLAQTFNVSFPGLSGTMLLTALDLEGVAVSHGSACASGSLEISHVLQAMKIPHDEAAGAIRFSFCHQTTNEQIDELLIRLKTVLNKLKQ